MAADLWRLAAIAATVLCGLSVDPAFARDPPLLSLTPEHLSATATLETDPLGNVLSPPKTALRIIPVRCTWCGTMSF